ncbi:c6 transcription factor 2 [Diplodia corticola]|uniref:C6 transcription factor 2 n=1 Tax=Diplodia corticola TaxID=236234 RepID=A0A1J9S2F0_9PEZI|nr:c6 transcription factor 2 [Diplodia corticola]OJD33821.1 c6 transcription factor 2 [Diplodia corticola]
MLSSSSTSDDGSAPCTWLTSPDSKHDRSTVSPRRDRPPSTTLRAACNDCHQAKVKCIFEDGSSVCVRCRKRSKDCARSLSKPLGRTRGPRKKPKEGRVGGASSPSWTANVSGTGPQAVSPSTPRDVSMGYGNNNNNNNSAVGCYADLSGCCLHNNGSGGDMDPLLVPSVLDATMDLWFDSAELASTPLLPDGVIDTKASTTTTTDARMQREDTAQQSPLSNPEAPPVSDAVEGCSCVAMLMTTMRGFFGSTAATTASSSTGSSSSNSSNNDISSLTRAPDELLRLNAAALDVARSSLACRGAHGGRSVRLLALWLVQGALCNCREAAAHASRAGQAAEQQQQQAVVRLGSYAVDDGEGGRLMAHRIIALQVRKAILPVVRALRDDGADGGGPGRGRGLEQDDDGCQLIAGLLDEEAHGMVALLSS